MIIDFHKTFRRQAEKLRPTQEDADERGFDPKNGYGFTRREVAGERVLAVDGTFTTGDSMATLIGMLRGKNGEVEDAAVIVDRSGGRSAGVARGLGVTLHVLFDFDEATHLLVPRYGAAAGG